MTLRPLILFAHGAGAPSSSPWMRGWSARLAALGRVVAFDYEYARLGRKRPDPPARLVETHRSALAATRQDHDGPIILAGKSMGGRIGAHVALVEDVTALVFFGYPLCGAGDRRKLRDAVLVETRVPCLFVQGTRDALAPLDLLRAVLDRMTARAELFVVDGGDHSLAVTARALRAAGETQADVDARIADAVERFLRTL